MIATYLVTLAYMLTKFYTVKSSTGLHTLQSFSVDSLLKKCFNRKNDEYDNHILGNEA